VNIEQKLHILSIEDSDEDFRDIQSVLNRIEGIQLSRAETLEDGLRLVDEISPDLVLLDYLLPGGDGFDFLRALKADKKDIPLVILTGQGDEMVASRLIQEGADDYLTKARFDRENITRCFRNVMEREKLKRELRRAQRKISEMATLDELTGLYNRRYFMEALERERARAERHGKDLSLCMMDLDLFKRVNDKLGHTAGDLVLADMGRIIRRWSRETDLPCRYGGEEFAVILPETALEGARVACERLRRMVEENQVQWRTGPIQITISIGVTQNRAGVKDSIRKLIDRADEALYQAKEAGRNRVKAQNGG
jgi:two-component system cell cycle response regulator